MESKISYADTEKELQEKIKKLLAEGWEIRGEMKVMRHKYQNEAFNENSMQYAQLITKKN